MKGEKRTMPYERLALWLLRESTTDRVLKNAATRILGETPIFEIGDKVSLNYGDDFNGMVATIVRRTHTKDGVRYTVCLEGCTGEIEGFSGDDMELNDRSKVDEWKKLRETKHKK